MDNNKLNRLIESELVDSSDLRQELNKVAKSLTPDNYGEVTGKLEDILLKGNYYSFDSKATLGPTTVATEIWKHNEGNDRIKVKTTHLPSGKVIINIF